MKIKIQKIALVLLFSAAYISLNAQQERGKLFLSVLGGYTGASGNFTKTEYLDAAAGYAAKSGFNIQLHSGLFVSNSFKNSIKNLNILLAAPDAGINFLSLKLSFLESNCDE